MFRPVHLFVVCALAALAGLSSCATQSVIETSWSMPAYQAQPFTKLAVISIMKQHAEAKAFEMAAADDLKSYGVEAVPGFSFMGRDTLMSKEEMERIVQSTGADGVLMFKLIAIDKTRTYIPPTTYVTGNGFEGDWWWNDPFWGYYNPYPFGYWGYWYPAWQVVHAPGYWVTDSDYQIETTLYRTSDNKLVWSARSGTYDPKNEADLGKSVSVAVARDLAKEGLIPTRRTMR